MKGLKKIYIVRHGESTGNRDRIFQPRDVLLTEIGEYQARNVAHRFKSIPIDVIISSNIKRVVQTAEIIAETIQKPHTFNKDLHETRLPSEIYGKRTHDPEALGILNTCRMHMHEKNWHFSDEENQFDRIARAERVMHYLELRSEENILLVTHSSFIRYLIFKMIFTDYLKPEMMPHVQRNVKISNGGITYVEFFRGRWHLKSLNDSAHLG